MGTVAVCGLFFHQMIFTSFDQTHSPIEELQLRSDTITLNTLLAEAWLNDRGNLEVDGENIIERPASCSPRKGKARNFSQAMEIPVIECNCIVFIHAFYFGFAQGYFEQGSK